MDENWINGEAISGGEEVKIPLPYLQLSNPDSS